MQPVRTLVAVHAHPDDEAITTGGILARFSAEGIRTVVVTCTGGGAGPRRDAGPDPLAAVRQAELRDALRTLRVSRGVELGFGDSGFPIADQPDSFSKRPMADCAAAIRRVLDEEQPEVVVTYDADGGYGHADHIRAHQATMVAVRGTGAAVYAVVFPRSVLWAFTQATGAESPALLGIDDMPAPNGFGVPDEDVTDAVDVTAYVENKRAAIAAHRSQMSGHVLLQTPASVWAKEYFRKIA